MKSQPPSATLLLSGGSGNGDLHEYFGLDVEFHELIYRAAGMHDIWESVSVLTTHYDRLRYFDVLVGTMRLKRSWEGHKQLYAALLAGDAGLAREISQGQMFDLDKVGLFIRGRYSHYFLDLDF